MESNMLENSLIHLLDAVDRLNETIPDVISIKYSVVHLWSGIKLLLEKKLLEAHWSLVYKDKKQPDHSKDNFHSGGFSPLDYQDLKKRLSTSCGIQVDEYGYVLDKIRNDFDKIELSRFTGSKVQITSNVVEVWPFIVDFISNHIDFSHDAYSRNLFNQTCEIMDSHLKFIRLKKMEVNTAILSKLQASYYAKPLKCPKCLQDAIPLVSNADTKYSCAFCGHIIGWKELAEEGATFMHHEGPFDCLNCDSHGVLKAQDGWLCLACCNAWKPEELAICKLCGARLVWTRHDTMHCMHCAPSAESV